MAALSIISGGQRMRPRKVIAFLRIVPLMMLAAVQLTEAQPRTHSGSQAVGERTAGDLYSQATATMLDREFASSRIEYLLVDAHSREIIAVRWPHAETPIAPGSLLKPFVALAFVRSRPIAPSSRIGEANSSRRFPSIECHGKPDGCWRPEGHGILELEQALAVSCNAYFLALARDVAADGSALQSVSAAYGLPSPPANKTAPELIGVTPEWRVTPLALVRAYGLLIGGAQVDATTSSDPISDPIDREVANRLRDGMRMAALPGGTAAKVGVHPGGVLAKTGTAPCVPEPIHAVSEDGFDGRCRINGDGLVMLGAPAENPRWLLLVRQHGTTGAVTAKVGGAILTKLEEADGAHR